MKRLLGIIVIIALIFTACGKNDDEGTDGESNVDYSALYGKWSRTSTMGAKCIFILSEGEIEYYEDSILEYKCEIQSVRKDTNNIGLQKYEYPEGFWIISVITEDGDPTDEYYIVGSSRSHFFYLNNNNDKMENSIYIYTKVIE